MARFGSSAVALLLAACGQATAFDCMTDIQLGGNATLLDRKGVNVDDITLRFCSNQVTEGWPNAAGSKLSSVRIFKAWDANWDPEGREIAWAGLLRFIAGSGAKVLLGTSISCVEDDDNQAWEWTKALASYLGPEHILGFAIGNELELLRNKPTSVIPEGCVEWIWGGYLWRQMTRFVAEFDDLGPGFDQIQITTVMTGVGLNGGQQTPFLERPDAAANSLFTNMSKTWGTRLAFTFNFYPFFGGWRDDSGCERALAFTNCFGHDCAVPNSVRNARNRIMWFTGDATRTLWIGETGWSSYWPLAATGARSCEEWATPDTFRNYYQSFLEWDLGYDPDECHFHVQVADTGNGDSGCAAGASLGSRSVANVGECRAYCNEREATHMSWQQSEERCECFSSCELSRPASAFDAHTVFYECGGAVPVDHAFFFSLRNALQFGKTEYFGLIDFCDEPVCKVASPGFAAYEYQNYSNGTEKCSGTVLFNGWSFGEDHCRDKCSVDERCGFYSLYPYSHTFDGLDHHWCTLTSSCCETEAEDIAVAIHAKRQVGYDTSTLADCEGVPVSGALGVGSRRATIAWALCWLALASAR